MFDPKASSSIIVPDFVGLPILQARGLANAVHVVLTSGEMDGPPLGKLTWPGSWVVTAQRPSPGQEVPGGSWVVIEFRDLGGGEAGDREPRTPSPPAGMLVRERDSPVEGSS